MADLGPYSVSSHRITHDISTFAGTTGQHYEQHVPFGWPDIRADGLDVTRACCSAAGGFIAAEPAPARKQKANVNESLSFEYVDTQAPDSLAELKT